MVKSSLSFTRARRPIVGVMGSHVEGHPERSRPLGQWIASQGYHLLTGAGEGVMSAVSQAFAEVDGRVGCVIGIVPTGATATAESLRTPLAGYCNAWVDIPVITHLGGGDVSGDEPMSRNHINILTSSVVVLLPGGVGTAGEARLAVRYDTPAVAFLNSRDEIPSLPTEVAVSSDFDAVTDFIEQCLATSVQ